MPIVKTSLLQDGDTPVAATLNQPYDDVATASATIDNTNTRDNWITRFHFAGNNACNDLYTFKYQGTADFATTSTSYTTINVAGLSEAVLNYAPSTNEILRVESSGIVSACTPTISWDVALPLADRGKPNYYAFQLLLTYNDGGPSTTVSLGEWGYSFTTASSVRYVSNSAGFMKNTGAPISWQTFQFSTTLRYDGVSGVRTYEKISLQAKVYDAANTLRVSRNNIVAVRAKH